MNPSIGGVVFLWERSTTGRYLCSHGNKNWPLPYW